MIRLRSLASFCRRMGIGLHAGVDILKLLDNETRSGDHQHRQVVSRMEDNIRAGTTLAKAMLEEKDYFPPLLIQMVHASELSGRLEAMFEYMAGYYEQLKKTRTLFLAKISWPIFQLCMAVLVIGLVIIIQGMLFKSSVTYDASGVGLRGASGLLTYCLIVGTFFGTVGLLVFGLWKNWFGCHRVIMPLVQRIPTLGTALVTLGLARLSMTLSMLLNAGVDARRSTKQAFLSTGNYYYIGGMDRALEEIEKGGSFGDAFEASGVLPDEFIESVRVGELSGTETESLDHMSVQYQQKGEAALTTIATIASMTIGLLVMLILAFLIIRMAMQYINTLNGLLP